MAATPILQLPYPVLSDPADVPADIKRLADRIELVTGAAPVTSLPVSPTDGQEVYFLADAANGVIWHLRYRAASASAYKWEFVGGGSLYAEVTTNEATTSLTYVDLATVGPTITLPVAGDYMIGHGFMYFNASVNVVGLMSYAIGATAAVDADSTRTSTAVAGANGQFNAYRERRKNALPAVALTSKFKILVAGSGNFFDRSISARPIRVG